MFFFEKRTKILSIESAARGVSGRPARTKVFLLLFLQKKKTFLATFE
jgi:hypothetical protein